MFMADFLTLDKVSVYNKALQLSNYIWDIVIQWEWLPKKTVGEQWIRSIDSISANIAEGFGRNGKKDKIKFYYYSKGSLLESIDWFTKAKTRNLLSNDQIEFLAQSFVDLPKEINYFIKFTNEKLKY